MGKTITTGTISCDFGESGHGEIDVAAATDTPIYAVKNATYESRISTAVFCGVTKFVNYGNHIKCQVSDKTVVYAHLSSFAQGSAGLYDSYRYRYTGTSNTQVKATWAANAGDQIGSTGNTGWSNGPHLHFEIYKTSATATKYDTFLFVVFPNVGYN